MNLIRCFVTEIINIENSNAAKKISYKIFAEGELSIISEFLKHVVTFTKYLAHLKIDVQITSEN